MSAETLIDRLDKVKATGPDKWIARCPAHDDRGPSLSIRNVGDKLLLHCFAGCEPLKIVHAVGLEFTDLFADAKLTGEQGHRCKPTQSRIPARDLLMLIEREATVVSLIGAKDIEQSNRLLSLLVDCLNVQRDAGISAEVERFAVATLADFLRGAP